MTIMIGSDADFNTHTSVFSDDEMKEIFTVEQRVGLSKGEVAEVDGVLYADAEVLFEVAVERSMEQGLVR